MARGSLLSQKNPKMLKNLTVAATGEFGDGKSHEKIRQWVENAGGTFTAVIDDKTTHLVASKDHWKRRLAKVRKARHTRGQIKVVNFDWLEDSLDQGTKKRESEYSWEKAQQMKRQDLREKYRKEEEARKQEHKEVTEQFHKGCKAAQEEINSDNHHIYQDTTGFDYDIILARLDVENNKIERYQLKLYESHTIPHTYVSFVKFCRPHQKPRTQLLTPRGSEFHPAFSKFQDFFRKKCQKHWSQRLETPKAAKDDKRDEIADEEESPEEIEARRIFGELAKNPETKIIDINAFKEKEAQRLLVTDRPFEYVQPKPGKPVGVFPTGMEPKAGQSSGTDAKIAGDIGASMRPE